MKAKLELVDAYLAALPHGIDSYPECELVMDAYEPIPRLFPALQEEQLLPQRVREMAAGKYSGKWVGEVYGNVLNLAIRELYFDSDGQFVQWFKQQLMTPMLNKPLLRGMMLVFSPSLIVIGAAKRWSKMRRGTVLEPLPIEEIGDQKRAVLTLRYPPRLYNHHALLGRFAATFQLFLEMGGAAQAEYRMEQLDEQRTRFVLTWRT